MYYRYFGLKEAPFSIAVDPRYLFMSARHRNALAHLLYGVGAGGGFILLTGPVGTGKTTITRSLLEQLPNNTDIALVLNPTLNAVELLATVCDELGISYQKDQQQLKSLTDKLHHYLLDNFSKNRNTVLLIDEAQHLTFETLEQIRLLTNLETNTKKLLQIILVAQPELKTILKKPELSQLAQRITARFQLTPLNLQETQAYIRHRLHIAGLPGNQQLFPKNIINKIFKISKGTPRIINVLCDRMLLGSFGQDKSFVNNAIAKQAISEVSDEEIIPFSSRLLKMTSVTVVILVALLLTWQLLSYNNAIAMKQEVLIAQNKKASNNSTTSIDQPWYTQQQQAINALANYLGKTNNDIICSKTLRCEHIKINNWDSLKKYQRPVVLKLYDQNHQQVYANLTGLINDQAELIFQKKIYNIPLDRLTRQWNGELILIWQAPHNYIGPIKIGHEGDIVEWLAQQFSKLDKQQETLATKVFNQALYQRVILFQKENQLSSDGVVGLKTLLKLQQQLIATPLLKVSS